jgi:hypothetical protein
MKRLVVCRSARWVGLFLAWSGGALAHGPPPFITGVVAADAEGPKVLVATEGLVQRREEGWYFVCPSLFGSDPSPPALSADGMRTFIAGQRGLYALESDGTASDLGRPELRRGVVVGFAAVSDRLFALRFSEGTSELVRVEDSQVIWSAAEASSAIAVAGDTFWIGAVAGGTGSVRRVTLEGVSMDHREVPLRTGEAISAVAAAGEGVYVTLVDLSRRGRVVWLDAEGGATQVAEASMPFRGLSITAGRNGWTASDGVLYPLSGSAPVDPLERAATCVGEVPGRLGYACDRTRLLALGLDGPGGVLADLAELQAPRTDALGALAEEICLLEWATFRDDLVAIGVLERRAVPTSAGTDAGGEDRVPAAPSLPSAAGCSMGRPGAPKRAAELPCWGSAALITIGRMLSRLRAQPRMGRGRLAEPIASGEAGVT